LRRLAGVFAFACLAVGCGESSTGSPLDDTLAYFPRDAGAVYARAPRAVKLGAVAEFLDFDPGPLGEYRGWLQATTERLRGSAIIELK
jgi:hypothetical protein